MEALGVTRQRTERLVRERIRLDAAAPEAFLRRSVGRARGFWARDDGWIAHAGEAATLEVMGREGEDRFSRVWEAARELLRPPDEEWEGGWSSPGAPPRLYGGFSFREDHRPTGFWSGFPSARFLLPELELVQGSQGTWLTAQTLTEPSREEFARERLRTLLEDSRRGLAEAPEPREPVSRAAARLETPRGVWESAVRKALAAMEGGDFTKVVLARILDVSTSRPLDPVEVLRHLREENTGAHVFLFEPEPGGPLIGAAPETVATLRRGDFAATAVAGSVPRGESADETRDHARRLLESTKDRVEHAIVVDDMVTRLEPHALEVHADPEPHVLTLARIQHLETHVRARAKDGETVLSLLEALHPTPAVCGYPTDRALEFLREEEPFERGWYAGPVGFFDAGGNGVFVPALRSAVARGESWRLFAGAGIVAASDPALEWEETGIKFEPVLRALSRSGAR
jgi:menaquinone-specific isochorismate synthase